jgi:hypothetical protein
LWLNRSALRYSDGSRDSDSATVTINIGRLADADYSYTTAQDTAMDQRAEPVDALADIQKYVCDL